MSFELSFAPEFFLQEGEPYDGGPEPSTRPTSVWQAIESMRVLDPERWADLARCHFECEPQYLTAETVLDAVRATNTCTDIRTPVEVWIDDHGHHTVRVFE